MAEIFIFGTFWFWALVAVEVCCLLGLVAQRNFGGGFLSFLVFVLLIQFFGDIDVFGFVANNPLKTLVLFFSYFVIGTLWASLKWFLLVLDNIRKAKDYREEWLKERRLSFGDLSQEDEARFYKDLDQHCPQARIAQHKLEFFTWMSFWWISLVITIFSDFFTRICKEVYHWIQGWLQGISDGFWKRAGFKIER
jgi:hypothetical protein